jgi:hypothetical protein
MRKSGKRWSGAFFIFTIYYQNMHEHFPEADLPSPATGKGIELTPEEAEESARIEELIAKKANSEDRHELKIPDEAGSMHFKDELTPSRELSEEETNVMVKEARSGSFEDDIKRIEHELRQAQEARESLLILPEIEGTKGASQQLRVVDEAIAGLREALVDLHAAQEAQEAQEERERRAA